MADDFDVASTIQYPTISAFSKRTEQRPDQPRPMSTHHGRFRSHNRDGHGQLPAKPRPVLLHLPMGRVRAERHGCRKRYIERDGAAAKDAAVADAAVAVVLGLRNLIVRVGVVVDTPTSVKHGGIVLFAQLESGRVRPTQIAVVSDNDLNRARLPRAHRGGEVVPEDG